MLLIQHVYYLEVILPAFFGIVYGIFGILRKFNGLYYTMGVLAIACLFFGDLAFYIMTLSGYTEIVEFQIGMLGTLGSALFFLTANIGPINSLTDDRSQNRKKYRIISLVGPLVVVLILFACVFYRMKIRFYVGLTADVLITALTAFSLYFSTKMALIPDVKGGFIDSMRPFNISITFLGLLNTLERGTRNLWPDPTTYDILMICIYGAIGICTIATIIFLRRGAIKCQQT